MDPVQLEEQFKKSLEIASGIQAMPVDAVERTQFGYSYLSAACPKCKTPINLSGEGKHLCRKCHAWVELRRVK